MAQDQKNTASTQSTAANSGNRHFFGGRRRPRRDPNACAKLVGDLQDVFGGEPADNQAAPSMVPGINRNGH